TLHTIAKGLAINILRNDIARPFERTDLMDGKNVWMIKSGSGSCFLDETTDALVILTNVAVQHLKGNWSVQLSIHCAKDLSHSSRANQLLNLVASDVLSGR